MAFLLCQVANITIHQPWENGYVKSFIGKLRDEMLDGEVPDMLTEAKVLV
jgi:putative transposase